MYIRGLLSVLVFTSGSATPVIPQAPAGSDSSVTAIVGATVIDGNAGSPLHNATIVVRGTRIAAIGSRENIAVPEGAREIDATGKFITPGFIDTNYQIGQPLGVETWIKYEDRLAEILAQGLQIALKHGVTTIRQSSGWLIPQKQVQAWVAEGTLVGSRYLTAGNIVGWGGTFSPTVSNAFRKGHPRYRPPTAWQARFNEFATQGAGEELSAMSPEALRVAINAYLDKKPDFIKYGATAHTHDSVLFSPEQQEILVEETHGRGKRIEIHSGSLEATRAAVMAGIDLIQHPERSPLDDELIELIVERGVICSMNAPQSSFDPGEEGIRNARKLIAAGCIVSIASDAALPGAPEFMPNPELRARYVPGLPTLRAIEGAVRLGMSPAEAIRAATKHGAIACGALKEYGTLEVGKYADLLILDADPLEDISNIRKLRLVIKEGRVVDRSALPTAPVYEMERTTSHDR